MSVCNATTAPTSGNTAITVTIRPSATQPPYTISVTVDNLHRRRTSTMSYLGAAYPIVLTDMGGYYVLTLVGSQEPPTTPYTQLSIPYGCHAVKLNGVLPTSVPLRVQSANGALLSALSLPLHCLTSYLNLSAGNVQVTPCGTSSAPATTTHSASFVHNADGSATIHLSAPK